MGSFFPLLLGVHVTLALALFIPGLVLPFTLRDRPPNEPGSIVRGAFWLQAHGTLVIGTGLALTGIAMLLSLGGQMIGQPWLLVALGAYALVAGVVYFVQRPELRRLLGSGPGSTEADQVAWRIGARRQRYLAYAITSAVGLIGFLMSTKPELW